MLPFLSTLASARHLSKSLCPHLAQGLLLLLREVSPDLMPELFGKLSWIRDGEKRECA